MRFTPTSALKSGDNKRGSILLSSLTCSHPFRLGQRGHSRPAVGTVLGHGPQTALGVIVIPLDRTVRNAVSRGILLEKHEKSLYYN